MNLKANNLKLYPAPVKYIGIIASLLSIIAGFLLIDYQLLCSIVLFVGLVTIITSKEKHETEKITTLRYVIMSVMFVVAVAANIAYFITQSLTDSVSESPSAQIFIIALTSLYIILFNGIGICHPNEDFKKNKLSFSLSFLVGVLEWVIVIW